MAGGLVFGGTIDERAKFVPDDPARFQHARGKLAGKRVELVLRRPRSKRSLDMNAYLHASTGPFRLLAEHFGEDLAGIKYALAGECFGWIYSKAMGREVPIRPNTSDWTVEESKQFVDWVIPWAAREYGVVIPLPSEIA
jgi:hypothetical protein